MSSFPLLPDAVEFIHDTLIEMFLPFDEHVSSTEYRSRSLIESAVNRPFQTAFGEDVWPTLKEKGAALFHSLACNHCFLNGNKRTAVLALDLFLFANQYLLVMSSPELYILAKNTAQANERGRSLDSVLNELAKQIEERIIHLDVLSDPHFRSEMSRGQDTWLVLLDRMVESQQQIVALLPKGKL